MTVVNVTVVNVTKVEVINNPAVAVICGAAVGIANDTADALVNVAAVINDAAGYQSCCCWNCQ